MNPETEKSALGWYVQTDWDYENPDGAWSGPFSSEKAALDWYFRVYGGGA